jgi:hypothetical protein
MEMSGETKSIKRGGEKMRVYLITYDLNKQGQDYKLLYDFFESQNAVKILESVYVLKTDKTVEYLRGAIEARIDNNDEYFISEIVANLWGRTNDGKLTEVVKFFENL